MKKTKIPEGYKSILSLYETQDAIALIKRNFQNYLAEALNLKRVSAPLFVNPDTGLNDDLNGIERAVSFDIPAAQVNGVIVHSLAKWKRMALWKYDFRPYKGLYTDMNAVRRDEDLDNLHSIYVDQWDWEKIILKENRTIDFLKTVVRVIVEAMWRTNQALKVKYPQSTLEISREVDFVTTQELEDMWPDLTPNERENAYVKDHPTTFLMQIGDTLKSGKKHDGRAPDYDDWSLNGDILFWNPTLDAAIELSSMGIRVDAKALDEQLEKANANDRRKYPFHQMILNNELPLTIGGGIGQSRLCMLLLGKAHVGEVQSSIWDTETQELCEKAGVVLL